MSCGLASVRIKRTAVTKYLQRLVKPQQSIISMISRKRYGAEKGVALGSMDCVSGVNSANEGRLRYVIPVLRY